MPLVIILRKGAWSFQSCSNSFPGKTPCPNKHVFENFLFVHTSRLKHFTFFRKFLLYKTKSRYLPRVVCLRGVTYICFMKAFYSESFGTKMILTTVKVFDIFCPQINDTKQHFSTFSASAPLLIGFFSSRRIAIRKQFFSET